MPSVVPSGQADGQRFERPDACGAGELKQPYLGSAERERDVCREAVHIAVPAISVETGGEVESDENRVLPLGLHLTDRLEDATQRGVEAVARADAEHRIENEISEGDVAGELPAFEVFGRFDDADAPFAALLELHLVPAGGGHVEGYDGSPVSEVTRGDHAVGSVVARADEDNGALASDSAHPLCDVAGDGKPGVLHERILGDASLNCPHFEAAHLLSRYDFHASLPTTDAAA